MAITKCKDAKQKIEAATESLLQGYNDFNAASFALDMAKEMLEGF